MIFGDNKGVPLGNGVDIFKGDDFVVFIDLEAGDLSIYNLAKDTILHLIPPFI